MRPRVFIPQVPMRYDPVKGRSVPKFDTLEHAKNFGDIVVLLDRNHDVWDPDTCIEALRKGPLSTFTTPDFILPMGSHHFMMWAAIVIAELKVPVVQSLQWHSRHNEYHILRTRIHR